VSASAVDFVRDLNRSLAIPPLSDLIQVSDLELLAEKAAANTSRPSNARDAAKSDFRAMLEAALASGN
jgi:alcohol dehydrogenase class IV